LEVFNQSHEMLKLLEASEFYSVYKFLINFGCYLNGHSIIQVKSNRDRARGFQIALLFKRYFEIKVLMLNFLPGNKS